MCLSACAPHTHTLHNYHTRTRIHAMMHDTRMNTGNVRRSTTRMDVIGRCDRDTRMRVNVSPTYRWRQGARKRKSFVHRGNDFDFLLHDSYFNYILVFIYINRNVCNVMILFPSYIIPSFSVPFEDLFLSKKEGNGRGIIGDDT